MDRELFLILAIFFNFCDYWITIIAIYKYGAKEANPIAKWLLKKPILMIFIKLVFLTYAFTKMGIGNLIFFTIIFGLVSLNNFIVILIKKRRLNKWV